MSDWFNELYSKRADLIRVHELNDFNLKTLLEDKYADPVHFVYELLQNAEDQRAKHVEFQLNTDHLVFKHYGQPFTRQDVASITNVGNSSKAGEANKIGCFGIGFKSVFDVTDRPEVYSTLEDEPFAFAIESKFVPIRLSCSQGLLAPHETRFVFPFKAGHEEEIFTKIASKLRTLGPETLLFLDHIESIKWHTTVASGEYVCERTDPMSGKVQLLWEQGMHGAVKKTEQTTFLRYSKISSFKRGNSELKVSLAFRLENDRVVPEEGLSVLHVFFPTSEKTGLKFRLHAPMLLTDSRANIRVNETDNQQLIKTCAQLLAESLPRLRDAGYLNTDCLNCLPVRQDDFPEGSFFRPIYEAVRTKLMGKEPLLPTTQGSSCSHVNVRCGKISESSTTRSLLKEAQLTELHGLDTSTPVCWLDEKIRKTATADLWQYLQKELSVTEIDVEEFASMIKPAFLASQTDEWITQFYTALLEARSLWEKGRSNPRLRRKEIIRLEDGTHVLPFDEKGKPIAYLPTGSRSDLKTVKMSIFQDDKAKEFLCALGLTTPEATDEVIRLILPLYTASTLPEYNAQEYALQLDTIARAIESCKPDESEELREHLLKTPFLRACNAVCTRQCRWLRPAEAYLPSWEMKTWFEGNEEAYFISGAVTNDSSWSQILKFLNTRSRYFGREEQVVISSHLQFRARTSSEHEELVLSYGHGWHRKCRGFDPQAQIDGLIYALEDINMERAQILWSLLVRQVYLVEGAVIQSTRRDYSNPEFNYMLSTAGYQCCEYVWLPDASGNFHMPADIMLSELPEGFDKTSTEAKILAKKLNMKEKFFTQDEIEAERLGITANILAFIKNNPDKIAQFVQSQQAPSHQAHFPLDDNVEFSQRRAEKVQEETRHAPEVRREVRERTVRLYASDYRQEKKAYLQDKYKTDEGVMFCQICEQTMPFTLSNGDPYFEMVQYVKGLPKETLRHYLALCPTCAAKYLYANESSPRYLQEAVLRADVQNANFTIPVRLAGEDCTVRFRKKHLGDLQNTLIGMQSEEFDSTL